MRKIKILVITIFVAISATYVLRSFKISEFECLTQFGECDNDLLVEVTKGKPMPYLDARSHINEIMRNNTQVYAYSYQLKLPNKISIDVLVRRPVFALRSESVESMSLIDQQGKVVKIVNQSDLPSLYLDTKLPNVGENLDRITKNQIDLVSSVYSSHKVRKAIRMGDDIYIDISGAPMVVLPSSEDTDYYSGSVNLVLSRLKHILQESKIDISEVGRLDFRYKDPIIVRT